MFSLGVLRGADDSTFDIDDGLAFEEAFCPSHHMLGDLAWLHGEDTLHGVGHVTEKQKSELVAWTENVKTNGLTRCREKS